MVGWRTTPLVFFAALSPSRFSSVRRRVTKHAGLAPSLSLPPSLALLSRERPGVDAGHPLLSRRSPPVPVLPSFSLCALLLHTKDGAGSSVYNRPAHRVDFPRQWRVPLPRSCPKPPSVLHLPLPLPTPPLIRPRRPPAPTRRPHPCPVPHAFSQPKPWRSASRASSM